MINDIHGQNNTMLYLLHQIQRKRKQYTGTITTFKALNVTHQIVMRQAHRNIKSHIVILKSQNEK